MMMAQTKGADNEKITTQADAATAIYVNKHMELLLATVQSYRLNSIWTHMCKWPGPATDFALKLCFEHPQSSESHCCFPWERDPLIQLLL